jgi:hypothetical protein
LKFEIAERKVNRQAIIVKSPPDKHRLPSAVRQILILLGLI